MKNAEQVLKFLDDNCDNAYCDDCLTINSRVRPHQQINQICRIRLTGKIIRRQGQCSLCGRLKLVNASKESVHAKA